MKNIYITVLACILISMDSFAQTDSIVTVKGQISDYFIPVTVTHEVKGKILDADGRPLEGATVMFFASPIHDNTAADGSFSLTAAPTDTTLYVYYPGMILKNHPIDDPLNVVITLQPENGERSVKRREKAKATEWYDPDNYNPITYCNPINISYNFEPYNKNSHEGGSFRSSADPMALAYGDEIFLFSTNQNGFHYSKNMTDWEFAPASFKRFPTDDDQCAPAAFVSNDTLFYTGSTYEGLPVWYSTDPKSGKWRRAVDKNVLPSWDPAFFLDDDGKLYLYYGSSNEYPLKGVQVSRDDFYPVSKIQDVLSLKPEEHGWERFGMNNNDSTTLKPFTEGAWMNKHNGKYYLQYGAPGTEFKIYADGVYVSDNPLGPFVYQKHNPMSYKPGGFVQGSGHGGTFKDPEGNYWHVSTCMVSLKYKFERRIGLYPVGFDEDGIMYSSSAFGDYPSFNLERDIKNPEERFTGWMLLSHNKPVTVSSTAAGHEKENAVDESMRTYWAAANPGGGEWISIDLQSPKTVMAVQLNHYEHNTVQHDRANDIYYQYKIFASPDGENWELIVDKSDNDKDAPHDYIELKEPLETRFIKVENYHVPDGHFALSGLRVFGRDEGEKPGTPESFEVKRSKDDPRNALISWAKVPEAYGYNIYYGISPEKLYNSITVLDDTQYDMRGLDRDTQYFFTVEAIGETGRSAKAQIISVE